MQSAILHLTVKNMKRFFSLILTTAVIFLSMTVLTVSADKIDLGVPDTPKIIANDYDEIDKFNSFSVQFNAGRAIKNAKDYDILLDWRVKLTESSDWHEVTQFYTVEQKDTTVGLFYVEPGSAASFIISQPDLYEALKPALLKFTTWSGDESLCFDRDNHTMEFQFRFRAEKEDTDSIIGAWSESVYYGKATLGQELPTAFNGKPEIKKINSDLLSEEQCEIKMTVELPTDITRYSSSTVGKVQLTAEIDLNNDGAWYEFFSKDIREVDLKNDISAVIDLTKAADSFSSDSVNIPVKTSELNPSLNVRIRCLWYTADKDGKYQEDASFFSEWETTLLTVYKGSDNNSSDTNEPYNASQGSLKFILFIIFISIIIITISIIITVIYKKKKKSFKYIA